MPKYDFTKAAKYAAEKGYIHLNDNGGIAIDVTRNDRFGKQLKDILKTGPEGVVVEGPGQIDPNDPAFEFMQRARQARLAAARAAMEKGWNKLGGPSSIVGLPIGNNIKIKEVGSNGKDGYTATFRGGTLHINTNGSTIANDDYIVVNINLVGIECQIRQEKTDEIYGVVSVLGPSNMSIVSRRFPDNGTIDMGPDGLRINQMNVPLVSRGVLQNYFIWAALVENDSGDVDVIANKVAEKFTEAAKAAVGALTGAPAESVADSQSFKENLATGLAWVFGDILGMGDDPYNAESFALSWADLSGGDPPVQPAVRRNDDPRTIQNWTHQLILSGVDDGGDRGQYALYFRVWTEHIHIETRKQVGP